MLGAREGREMVPAWEGKAAELPALCLPGSGFGREVNGRECEPIACLLSGRRRTGDYLSLCVYCRLMLIIVNHLCPKANATVMILTGTLFVIVQY